MTAANRNVGGSWALWLRAQLSDQEWTGAELARRADIDASMTSRWLNGKTRPREADVVRKVCRALDIAPAVGMVAAGLLEPEDIGGEVSVVQSFDPSTLTKAELLAELDRRIPAEAPEVPDVTELHGDRMQRRAARRRPRSSPSE